MSMAEPLDDGEFWLPSKFLADDDLANEKKLLPPKFVAAEQKCLCNTYLNRVYGSPFINSCCRNSICKSSQLSSISSEREQYYYHCLVDLNRKLAAATALQEVHLTIPKERNSSGSPRSTLYPMPNACGCHGSFLGSPNHCAQVVSSQQETWNLLNAAASEVEKLKINEGLIRCTRNIQSDKATIPNLYPPLGEYHRVYETTPSFPKQLIHTQDGKHLLPVNMSHSYVHMNDCSLEGNGLSNTQQGFFRQSTPVGHPVFVGGPTAVKKQSVGTGVFLPRRNVSSIPSDTRKDAGSTVLLPARVVKALNLNLEDLRSCTPLQYNLLRDGNRSTGSRVRTCEFATDPLQKFTNKKFVPDVRLPQEWTY